MQPSQTPTADHYLRMAMNQGCRNCIEAATIYAKTDAVNDLSGREALLALIQALEETTRGAYPEFYREIH